MPTKHPRTKRRIALIQLEKRLRLLERGDPVSALTLAGAAEEILGRAASRKGHEPRVGGNAYDWFGSFYDWAKTKKQLISHLNTIRNLLKHQDDGWNIKVEEFEFEVEEMILRFKIDPSKYQLEITLGTWGNLNRDLKDFRLSEQYFQKAVEIASA